MSVYGDFQQFVTDLEKSSTYKNWCSAHSGDCGLWQTYRTGVLNLSPAPAPPVMSTSFGKALVDVGMMAVDAGLVPPPPHPPLTAAFHYSITGLSVLASDDSTAGPSGPIIGWDLDWGDSSPHSSGPGPWVHTYSAAGTYNAKLTVISADGTASVTHPLTVTSSGPGTLLDDFISYTSWTRPSFTPSRLPIQYHDEASFRAAITGLQPGDLVMPRPGCGEIVIQSSSSIPYQFSGKNPSIPTVIDLGTKKSIWGSPTSGDYVKFSYTGTGNVNAVGLQNCSNLRLYGGEITTGNAGGDGLVVEALTHDVLWYDAYVNVCGGSGHDVRGNTSGGSASKVYDVDFRFEINRCCMNPAHDNHDDRGTGIHGLILHGNDGDIYGTAPGKCRFVVYCHDPLKPGEFSAGQTWPEGACGSCCEQGNHFSSENYSNVDLYLYGENLLMDVNATPQNPGSTIRQTGGNILNVWGHAKLNGGRVWFWGVHCSGSMLDTDTGSWFPGSPVFTAMRGRAHDMNQVHGPPGHNISVPYPTTTPTGTPLGITYIDCTVV